MTGPSRAMRWLLVAPAALAFLVQARGLSNGFFGDDYQLVLENPDISGAFGLRPLLLSDWFARSGHGGGLGYYRPVSKLSLWLTWRVAGPRPLAFHLGNVLAHAAAVGVFTLLAVAIAGRRAGLIAAFLYAVHPMTVQAVQNVTARSDLLAAGFAFLSALAFLRWCEGSHAAIAVATAAAALGAGSKESALLLPVLLLGVGLRMRVPWRRLGAGLVAPTGAILALGLVRLVVLDVHPLPNALATLNWGNRVACALEALGGYVSPILLGTPIVRLPQVPRGPLDPGVAAGIAVVAAAALLCVRGRLRSAASFAVVLAATTLAPVMAVWLLRIGMWRREVPIAERWLYAPVAGGCLLAGIALGRLSGRRAAAATAGVAGAYAAVTWSLIPAYASDRAYEDFRATTYLDHAPRNPREEYLGGLLRAWRALDAGNARQALAELRGVDEHAPGLATHLLPMARLELQLGNPGAAASVAARLLSQEFADAPTFRAQRDAFGDDSLQRIPRAPVLEVLGRALAALGHCEEARAALGDGARAAPTPAERARLLDLATFLAASAPCRTLSAP